MATKMREAIFNTEVVNTLKSYGWFAYKLGDMIPSASLRFIPEKPCDIISCTSRGQLIAIESKQIKKWSGLKAKMLRDNQVSALDKVVKNSGLAFLLLNIRIPRHNDKQAENWCVVFNWAKHREAILNNEYTSKVLQEGYVGEWVQPIKVKKKILWKLKNISKL